MATPLGGSITGQADGGVDPSQETLSLLMDEIARLEAELAARDSESSQSPRDPWLEPAAPEASEVEDALREEVSTLSAELASRDETMALLLEHLSLYEEAAAAQKAEWEQLHEWVGQLERRVDDRAAGDSQLLDQLEAERRLCEDLRAAAETQRKTALAERRALEDELQAARKQLLLQGPAGETELGAALAELEDENRRLRGACAELQEMASGVNESQEWKFKYTNAAAELDEAKRELRSAVDERLRERNEFAVEIAGLKSQLAQESLAKAVQPRSVEAGAAPKEGGPPSAIEADERIRAFRLHLKELHDTEDAQRRQRGLAARLSRLWHHTGPS